jgi:3',5'-cyclic AMP phosphodiesterase CpdA
MTFTLRTLAAALTLAAPAVLLAQEPEQSGRTSRPVRYADKLYYKPTPVPDRMILTWNGDPATTQAVTWRTDTSVKSPIAQLAESEDGPGFDNMNRRKDKDGKLPPRPDPDRVRTVPAATTPLSSDLGEALCHSVTFDGLRPKTRYVYRVGDGANWTEWFEFRTPSDRPEPLRFIYFGDAQNEVKSHWSRVARGAYSDMPKAHFILHAGDLINRANADGEWGEWHAAAGWINGMVPCVPTPGNHEYAAPPKTEDNPAPRRALSGHWRPQFALPENGPPGLEETCYYLDIQGVRVVSLNSNERHQDQVPWLENVLASNPHRWTVVTFHHPVYSTAASRQKGDEERAIRKLWRPVFDKYAVDLVLQGHDHSYGRSGLMREDNVLEGTQVHTQKGTVYCVSVSGPKMYELGPQEWMVQKAGGIQLYQLITIDGARLHYEARTAKGDLFDEFELRKRPDGGNTLVERAELEAERAAGPERAPTRTQLIVALAAMVALAGLYGVYRLWRGNGAA